MVPFFLSFFLFIIYLFLAVSGLSCSTQALCCGVRASICGVWVFSSLVVAWAPGCVGFVVCGMQTLVEACKLSSCGARA